MVEFIQHTTNVGMFASLVTLTSIVANRSVELPEGTMPTISAAGNVMLPSEFTGGLMKDFKSVGGGCVRRILQGRRLIGADTRTPLFK